MRAPEPPRPGPHAVAARLGEILRVDHAGELAAVHIYRGQRAVLQAGVRLPICDVLERMETQEAAHLARFDRMLVEGGVRPTLLAPLWRLAGFVLGVGTALLGEKAAHACTEAVEEVIEDHYTVQIAELSDQAPELAAELARFRDDEASHRAEAVAAGAREAPAHGLLTRLIRVGCRCAIAVSEKL